MQTRELLFEVAVLEEEVIFLEKHAVYLRQELEDEKPESSSSLRTDGGEEAASVSKKTLASETKIPASEVSEPTTPNNPVTPLLTPFDTPEWRPSGLSSPTIHEENMSLPSSVPSDFALPRSMKSPPPHGDKPDSIPPQVLNRKRVIRRGSSSSESVPADASERYDADRNPSRKKPNHKKSQSLSCVVRKADVECEANFARSIPGSKEAERDVYERLSAPKKGIYARASARPSVTANSDKSKNGAPKWSANGKDFQSRHLCRTPPRPATSLDEKVKNCVKVPVRKKELPGRSPPLASPQLEAKKTPYFRRSSSLRETETECSLASTPSPVFEDKAIASIRRIVSSMSPTGSPQPKFHNCSNSPLTPTAEQGNQDRPVTPFKLPAPGEKENGKILTPSDERRRTHDLVITKSLPPIKLNMGSKVPSPLKGNVHHRLTVSNNFSENAKLYAKAKLSSTPTKQEFKVRPVQVQKPSSKGDDNEQNTSKLMKFVSSKHQHQPENYYVDDDYKVCYIFSTSNVDPYSASFSLGTVEAIYIYDAIFHP